MSSDRVAPRDALEGRSSLPSALPSDEAAFPSFRWRTALPTVVMLALAAGSIGVLSGGPVGYGAATYHWTRQRGMSRQGAMLCGWLPGIMNTAVLVVSVTILLLAATWVLAREDRTVRLATRILRVWNRIRRRRTDSATVAAAVEWPVSSRRLIWSGGWRQPLLGAVANAWFDVVTLFCLFVATRQVALPDDARSSVAGSTALCRIALQDRPDRSRASDAAPRSDGGRWSGWRWKRVPIARARPGCRWRPARTTYRRARGANPHSRVTPPPTPDPTGYAAQR